MRQDQDGSPTPDELQQALTSLKNGKAPGVDGIPAEVLKHSGTALHKELLWLCQRRWEDGAVPQDFKDAIYKRKGDRRDCGNSRGFSPLSIAAKGCLIKTASNLGGNTVGESVRVQTRSRHHRYDLCVERTSRKSRGTKNASVHGLYRLYKGF